ncbi:hypothetical protein [Halobium salinum]|uniref:hypothetical protein n=1 Tax=Halobium salinum TaxID=1364940 RepID=UPI00226E9E0A|nr:hypothetical protein [Halobium salinum]
MAGMWKSRGELELRTRFMDRKRAGKSWASAVTPLENAAEGHEVATEITVTTWPFINDKDGEEKFENIPHMREELVDSIESLLKKLMREAVDKNQAPDYQTFFEYTDTGIPHAHVLVYGFSPDELMDEEEIAQYMYYQRRHCKEVSVRGVHVGEAGRWRYDDTDVPVRAYLLKGLRTLLDVAEGKKDMGRDAFSSSAGKMVPWKLALYMEMESRFSTNSQRLNSPIEEPKFEFIEYPETSILDVAECERDSESGRRNLAAQSPLDAVDRPASGLGRIHRAVVATLPVTLIVLISWLWGLIDRIE